MYLLRMPGVPFRIGKEFLRRFPSCNFRCYRDFTVPHSLFISVMATVRVATTRICSYRARKRPKLL